MKEMKNGKTVKINTTFDAPDGETPGLGYTLNAYEDGWNINEMKDPIDMRSAKYNESGKLKGPGSKP